MPDYADRRRMMVDTQVRPSDVTEFPIIDAMLRIPREAFVPSAMREAAYAGENLPIGDQRVVLEPRTFAKMLDELNLNRDEFVLIIGAGLGYATAVTAQIAQAVVAVEEDPDFAAEAQDVLAEQNVDNATIIVAPLAAGAPEHGPYDVVLVEGAVEQMSDAILEQLKDGGRIVAPFLEGTLGVVRIGYKLDGRVNWRFAFNASAPVLPGFEEAATFTL